LIRQGIGQVPPLHWNRLRISGDHIASDLADFGVFIIPQASAPFEYSGKQCFRANEHEKYRNFLAQTAIALGTNCGLDTSVHRNDWSTVPPAIEIVTADFLEARNARALAMTSSSGALDQMTLF